MNHHGDYRSQSLFSLVFPTFNPGDQVEKTWNEVRTFLTTSPLRWEILFVCDGCTDSTPERLTQLTQSWREQVRVLNYPKNRGKGYAVRLGMTQASGTWRLFTDFDLAYDFPSITRVAEALRNGADVAIASRELPQSEWIMPPTVMRYLVRRRTQSWLFRRIVRLLLPIRFDDTQAGLKGMSARAVEIVFPHLQCDGFGFDCEILTACAKFGIAVQEIPVRVRCEDQASTTRTGATIQMIRELFRIRRAWRSSVPSATPSEARIQAELGRKSAAA